MGEKAIIRIGGMSCVRCSAAVEHALKSLDGVISVNVSYASEEPRSNTIRKK